MKHIVIGYGQIGKAIQKVFNASYHDSNGLIETRLYLASNEYKCMHICFPFKDKGEFEANVLKYNLTYKPNLIVVHSTVPVGATAAIRNLVSVPVVHSPVRGIHPNLYQGVMTFQKFIGGPHAHLLADEFRKRGLKVVLCDKSETTELGKLLDTEYYRTCIEFALRSKELSEKYDVPFHEAYTLFNTSYNEGYKKLDHEEYVRPVLQPIKGPIGGHCVLPNKKLLEDE